MTTKTTMDREARRKRRLLIAGHIMGGLPVEQVCEQFAVSAGFVWYCCREGGVATVKRTPGRTRSARTFDVLARLLYTTKNAKEIALEFGVQTPWIHEIARDAIRAGMTLQADIRATREATP